MSDLRSATHILGLLLLAAGLVATPAVGAENWESTVPPYVPGLFPEMRPGQAVYHFGWNGFTAATANLRFSKTDDGQLRLEATGQTIGLARQLWKFDVESLSTADAPTLRPMRVKETESVRSKRLDTEVIFSPEKVTSRRTEERRGHVKTKTRQFDFPNALSLSSAMLYLRGKPLADGAVERVIVYPQTTGYLCTVTVIGRESFTGPTGSYQAIKLEVKLNKIGDHKELLAHKKFKHATVWLSDDAERLILRIESQIFLGTVFAELQSVQFEQPKS